MHLLWSINERLGGRVGSEIELPDMGMIVQDCMDLCELEQSELKKIHDETKAAELRRQTLGM